MDVERARELIQAALADVDQDLATGGDSALPGLPKMKGRLTDMLAEVEAGTLPKKTQRTNDMGRTIVDSWDLDSDLGEKIIKAEEAYRKV
ncbi:hypothetical protein ACFL51_00880 [Myxococcota bacterium]